MATTEDDDVNVGEGSGDPKQDYLAIASVLLNGLCDVTTAGTGDGASTLTEVLEIAAQELGIEGGDEYIAAMALLELGHAVVGCKRVEERCTDSCGCHFEKPAIRNLWKELPLDLQMIIFANLPLGATSHLKSLNKEWTEIFASAYFHRLRSIIFPRMVCFITRIRFNMFWVRVLDHLRQEWHTYRIRLTSPIEWRKFGFPPHMFAACEDQGLICFVTQCNSGSKTKKNPPTFNFNVVNPLTRSDKELPPLSNCTSMRLVRIHVDETTKAFKVFAFARRSNWTRPGKWTIAEVAKYEYNSRSDEWITTDGSDGVRYDSDTRLAYDFGNGRLFDQDGKFGVSRSYTVLSKGRLFMLRVGSDGPALAETGEQSQMFYIEEFHWQTDDWVKVNSHRCDPFERPPKLLERSIHIHACDGFLMVGVEGAYRSKERFRLHRAWLYDLSTKKWSILDQFPQLPVAPRTYDPNDEMIQRREPPGGSRFYQKCDNTYNISMMLEPKWVT